MFRDASKSLAIAWLIGKVYQAIEQYENALNHFETACKLEHTNPDLPREASISAIDIGKLALARPTYQELIGK